MNTSSKPVLVTLTAPSAGGKSYLYSHIRDVAKLPCLVSTTTRAPRAGEVDGVDYYFITEEESKRLEAEDQLAELAIYRGYRYGVTKQEFHTKLHQQGIAFLVVEPSGIDHYVKPALEAGAMHLNVYLDTPLDIRLDRFKARAIADMVESFYAPTGEAQLGSESLRVLETYLDRLTAILTVEETWKGLHNWDLIISGLDNPTRNSTLIQSAVMMKQIGCVRG